MNEKKMASRVSIVLDKEVKEMAEKGWKSKQDKYDSLSHFVRCAIIKLYRSEFEGGKK